MPRKCESWFWFEQLLGDESSKIPSGSSDLSNFWSFVLKRSSFWDLSQGQQWGISQRPLWCHKGTNSSSTTDQEDVVDTLRDLWPQKRKDKSFHPAKFSHAGVSSTSFTLPTTLLWCAFVIYWFISFFPAEAATRRRQHAEVGRSSAGDASVRPGSSDKSPGGCFSLLSRSRCCVVLCVTIGKEFVLPSNAVFRFRVCKKLLAKFTVAAKIPPLKSPSSGQSGPITGLQEERGDKVRGGDFPSPITP